MRRIQHSLGDRDVEVQAIQLAGARVCRFRERLLDIFHFPVHCGGRPDNLWPGDVSNVCGAAERTDVTDPKSRASNPVLSYCTTSGSANRSFRVAYWIPQNCATPSRSFPVMLPMAGCSKTMLDMFVMEDWGHERTTDNERAVLYIGIMSSRLIDIPATTMIREPRRTGRLDSPTIPEQRR